MNNGSNEIETASEAAEARKLSCPHCGASWCLSDSEYAELIRVLLSWDRRFDRAPAILEDLLCLLREFSQDMRVLDCDNTGAEYLA